MVKHKHFFIVGFPRSGTTLLSALLNSHSYIVATPETQFFTQGYLRSNSDKIYPQSTLSDIYEKTRLCDLNLPKDKILLAAKDAENDLVQFYKNLLRAFAESKASASIIAEKSPDHIKHIPLIEHHFPDANIIFIHRDPRAAISSLLRTQWNRKGIVLAALEYRYVMQLAENSKHSLITVSYENLTSQPSEELSKFCSKVRIPFEVGMIENKAPNQVIPKWETAWKGNSLHKPNIDSHNKWKRDLRPEQIKLIESCNFREMQTYGYEPLFSKNVMLSLIFKSLFFIYKLAKDTKIRYTHRWT